MTVKSYGISFFYSQFLQAVNDPVLDKEFLKEDKSFFGFKIRVSEHSFDPGTLNDVFAGVGIKGYGKGC